MLLGCVRYVSKHSSKGLQIRTVSLEDYTSKEKVFTQMTDAILANKYLSRWKLICESSKLTHRDQFLMMRSEFVKMDPEIKGPETYLAYLTCNANQGNYLTCWSLIDEMKSKNIPITKQVLFRLVLSTVNGCNVLDAQGFSQAREVAIKGGLLFDSNLYRHILSHYSKRHRLYLKHGMASKIKCDTAFNMFKFMIDNDSIKPDAKMWGIILSTRSSFDSAMKVFDKMLLSGITPNIQTYALLMRVCSNSRDVEGAERVLKIMKTEDIEIDIQTYCCLMTAYKNEGSPTSISKVIKTWEFLKRNKIVDEVVITIVMGACSIGGSPNQYEIAKDAFRYAIAHKAIDSSVLHAITTFAKKREDLEMLRSIHQYCVKNNKKNSVTSSLKSHTDGWKKWKGNMPFGTKKKEIMREKTNNISVSVDIIEPPAPSLSRNQRRRPWEMERKTPSAGELSSNEQLSHSSSVQLINKRSSSSGNESRSDFESEKTKSRPVDQERYNKRNQLDHQSHGGIPSNKKSRPNSQEQSDKTKQPPLPSWL